jgi:hypothetical protein
MERLDEEDETIDIAKLPDKEELAADAIGGRAGTEEDDEDDGLLGSDEK